MATQGRDGCNHIAASAGMQELSHSLIPGEFSPVPLQIARRVALRPNRGRPPSYCRNCTGDYFTTTCAVTECERDPEAAITVKEKDCAVKLLPQSVNPT